MELDELFGKIGSTQTLSQKIERKIEEGIRNKTLTQGMKIPTERELCEKFGVSRTAIREALRRLDARGLVDIRKGDGMYVSEITMEDAIKTLNLYYDLNFDDNLIDQIFEVRINFEPSIASLAAINRTDEDIRLLEENLQEFINCDDDNVQYEVDLDNKFHTNIAKATENPFIIATMEPIYVLLPRFRNFFYGNVDGEKNYIVEMHRNIIKAIIKKDAITSAKLIKEHSTHSYEVYKKYLKRNKL